MKKFYLLVGALLAFTTLNAQNQKIVDFESLPLAQADTFYNGADSAGFFIANGVTFQNEYNTQYDMMANGYAYSNKTDNTTAGFTNMYSAYPGKGANQSKIYAVSYFGGVSDTIFFPENKTNNLVSVDITNTTYAYLSMKNGDAYAKKFGSPKDANGDDDGTNGKDFFYVTFYGFDSQDNLVDSVQVYLADFRSNNSTEHYILNSWKTVDLSSLEGISYITYTMASSDVGQYGMNTPAYFGMDHLVYNELPKNAGTIENSTQKTIVLYPNPATNYFSIKGTEGSYSIYSVSGKKVMDFVAKKGKKVNVSNLNRGLYFVKPSNSATPSISKLIVK